jgi:Transposase DDE domain
MSALNIMDEDWDLLLGMLPAGWRELARETGATKGLRKVKDEGDGLRALLLHLACGYSLRETSARAQEAGLADLSDVALFKRLRKSKEWLHGLCRLLLQEQAGLSGSAGGGHRGLRLVDATVIQEPGPTGSTWRLHYSLCWPRLACDHFELTAAQGRGTGESLARFPAHPGDHLVADRGYSHYQGIKQIIEQGAAVTVRLHPTGTRLLDGQGQPFALRRHLKRIKKTGEVRCWPASLAGAKPGEKPVPGRLCVLRKSQAATAKAEAKARRKASANGHVIQPETLFYAGYVMIFTTASPSEFTARQILEVYRLRWQIELVFKRFKQLAQMGHLPKEDEESSKAWLYGKLLVALLTERLLAKAESFSPWGYEVAPAPNPQPLAGV